jgi:hypothetical protein
MGKKAMAKMSVSNDGETRKWEKEKEKGKQAVIAEKRKRKREDKWALEPVAYNTHEVLNRRCIEKRRRRKRLRLLLLLEVKFFLRDRN